MKEKLFSEKDSLELISQMLKQTRQNLEVGSGNIFLYYGYAALAISLLVFVLIFLTGNPVWAALWFVMFIVSFVIQRKAEKNKPHVVTYMDKAISNTWSVLSVLFLLTVFAVEFFDKVAKIDDPVGAVSVHCVCGALGTILTGLFATGVNTEKGLFYGGGFHFLGVQVLGVVSVAAYVAIVITIVFQILKHTIGLRASAEEEIAGLDVSEHGLLTAYAGFEMLPDTITDESEPVVVDGDIPVAEAVPVKKVPTFEDGTPKFTKVEIICKESRLESLKASMMQLGITGMTVSHVLGCGVQKGKPEYYRGVQVEATLLPKVQVDIVVSEVPVRKVIETAKKVLYTGHIGDGKIFVYDVENVVKVRTGEEGFDALQDVE